MNEIFGDRSGTDLRSRVVEVIRKMVLLCNLYGKGILGKQIFDKSKTF